MTTLQQRACRALLRDDSEAISFEGRWIGWGELRKLADRLDALMADSGIGPDASVVFVPRNRPSSVAALLALIRQGRTIRMSCAFQSASGIVRDIGRLRPGMIVVDMQDLSEELVQALRNDGIGAIGLCDMEASAVPGLEFASPATPITPERNERVI